jgi:hypothetical protein
MLIQHPFPSMKFFGTKLPNPGHFLFAQTNPNKAVGPNSTLNDIARFPASPKDGMSMKGFVTHCGRAK